MDKELQRQTLLVQLKILKELRLLNKNYENQRRANGKYESNLSNLDLEDVREAIAQTGKIFI